MIETPRVKRARDVARRSLHCDEGTLLAVELLLGVDRHAEQAVASIPGEVYGAAGFLLVGAGSAAVAVSGATEAFFVEAARASYQVAAAHLAPRGHA